jgi:hypothetical protein
MAWYSSYVQMFRQQWRRFRLQMSNAPAPQVRQFYTSDFFVIDGVEVLLYWKVDYAWKLELSQVPIGQTTGDVSGRIYARIVARMEQPLVLLRAYGRNGQVAEQFLHLAPTSVRAKVPAPVLVRRTPVQSPLAAERAAVEFRSQAWPRLSDAAWTRVAQPAVLSQPLPPMPISGALQQLHLTRYPRVSVPEPVRQLQSHHASFGSLWELISDLQQTGSEAEARALAAEAPTRFRASH